MWTPPRACALGHRLAGRAHRALELVPTRFEQPAGVPVPGGRSAVADFRSRLVAYEDQHATLPREDLQFAALSSLGLVVFAGFVAFVLPSPYSLSSGSFVVVGKNLVAGTAGLLKGMAWPLAVIGVVGLALDGAMAMHPRLPIIWHYVCAAQPIVVIGIGAIAAFLALGLLISLAIWLLLIAAVLLVLCLIVAGLFAADG
jgi:hypothetical protein